MKTEKTKSQRLNLIYGLFARIHFKQCTDAEYYYMSFHYDHKIEDKRFYGTVESDKTLFIKKKSFSIDKLQTKNETKTVILKAQNYYILEILPNLKKLAKEKELKKQTTEYICNSFLEYKKTRTSNNTFNAYKILLNDFLKSELCPKYYNNLTLNNIVQYLDTKNYKGQSYNLKLSIFKIMDTWQSSQFNNNPILKSIKDAKQEIKDGDEYKAPPVNNEKEFIRAIDLYLNNISNFNVREFLIFMFFLPLRPNELLSLKVSNIDFNNNLLVNVKTKTYKNLTYPISEKLASIFKSLITKYQLTENDYILSISRAYKTPIVKVNTTLKKSKCDYHAHAIRKVLNSYVTTYDAQKRFNISEADCIIYGDILLTHENKTVIQKKYNKNTNFDKYKELNQILHTFEFSILKMIL